MRMKYLRSIRDWIYRSHILDLCFVILQPFCHRVLHPDAKRARRVLEAYSPCPHGTAMARHQLIEPFRFDLRIIINVYNLEQYIRECVDSILAQKTTYSWQLVLIDDGSTDASPEILDAYAADPHIRVIHQPNMGPDSKNAGLKDMDAAYLMFVDGDDLLEQGAIQSLLETAYERDADIVQMGYSRLEEGHLDRQRNVKKPQAVTAYGQLSGFAWGKVIRSRLFKTVQFPPGFWHPDTVMALIIHPMAEKRYMIPAYGYIYRCSSGRLSKRAPSRPKCIDTYFITERMLEEHAERRLACDSAFYDEFLRQVLLNARRTRRTPAQIKEAIFVLTAELTERFFEREGIRPRIHQGLRKALMNRDYGVYRLYCRTHF